MAGVDLSGYTVVLFNGNGESAYNRVELTGTTNDVGLIWIGPAGFSPNPQLTFTAATNAVQNGADGVALVQGTAADFPGGSGIPEAGIIDALAYDTSDGDDAGLLEGLYGAGNPLAIQINENENAMKDTQSIQRCGDARLDGNVWIIIEPTAGAANSCP